MFPHDNYTQMNWWQHWLISVPSRSPPSSQTRMFAATFDFEKCTNTRACTLQHKMNVVWKKKQVWHSLWHRQWSAPGRAFRARLAARQSPTANRVGGFRPKLQSRTKCPEEEKKWLSVKKTPSKNKYCLICSMVNALRKAAICSPRYRKIQNQNLLSETAILS